MDPKKDRRVRKIKVPTDSVPECELRGHNGRYTVEEGGDGGKRKRRRGTEIEGQSQEGGSYKLSRGGSGRKARQK